MEWKMWRELHEKKDEMDWKCGRRYVRLHEENCCSRIRIKMVGSSSNRMSRFIALKVHFSLLSWGNESWCEQWVRGTVHVAFEQLQATLICYPDTHTYSYTIFINIAWRFYQLGITPQDRVEAYRWSVVSCLVVWVCTWQNTYIAKQCW